MQGDTLLVSSTTIDASTAVGVVTVFFRVGPSWLEQAILEPAARDDDSFGKRLALDGNSAVVSSLAPPNGAAFVFVRNGTSWIEQAKLVRPPSTPEAFGISVAISSDTLLVGSVSTDRTNLVAGSAYVFVRSAGTWREQARLRPSVAQENLFARAVALSGDVALVGSGSTASNRGSAYVFVRTGTTWAEQARLVPQDGTVGDGFGGAVAVSGGRALVGAPSALRGAVRSGAVYVFTRSGTSWSDQDKVTPLFGTPSGSDEFGSSVAAEGDQFVTGGPGSEGPAPSTGSAHWFEYTGEWIGNSITSKDTVALDRYGQSVAVSGRLLAVGAPNHSTSIPDSGAVFVYGFGFALGDPCTTSDQCALGACSDGVCCDRVCTGPCESCVAVLGSTADGVCTILGRGVEVPACAPFVCDGQSGTCPNNCGVAGCAPFHFCSATSLQCEPKKLLGESCFAGMECLNRVCADGVCCDTDCSGCHACRVAFTGVPEGLCAPVLPGNDPHELCPADPAFPLSCGADGMCDGGGQCRSFAPPTTPCGATSCQAGSIIGKLCNGLGGCGDGSASCAPYVCMGGACSTICQGDADCAATAYCDTAGICRNRLANGVSCVRAEQCASGHCVDGVCCNSRCEGQCEWCADPMTSGTCTAAVGDAPPGRPACSDGSESNVCERARCDGMVRDRCAAFVGRELVCAASTCAEGSARLEGRCDGKGGCSRPAAANCFPYACGETDCKRVCSTSADCAKGAICTNAGECTTDAICDGDHTLTAPSGEEEDCSPYLCNAKGACFSACTSTKQCVAGHICASSGRCEAAAPVSDSAGCALNRPQKNRSAWPLLALSFAGLRVLRRRAGTLKCPSAYAVRARRP